MFWQQQQSFLFGPSARRCSGGWLEVAQRGKGGEARQKPTARAQPFGPKGFSPFTDESACEATKGASPLLAPNITCKGGEKKGRIDFHVIYLPCLTLLGRGEALPLPKTRRRRNGETKRRRKGASHARNSPEGRDEASVARRRSASNTYSHNQRRVRDLSRAEVDNVIGNLTTVTPQRERRKARRIEEERST